ncbi:tail assembly chaperone [Arthrobacter phage CallinAllBarbz]|uniref:Tail assembly chaperone n=1 Tax=Arthrobacter phage CallinAllBarbz TaxID=3077790 RepID=A0AA96HD16_9CAUD|nr:tail assembly chaperone [Arthrobacter phage CallinAllBarbz]
MTAKSTVPASARKPQDRKPSAKDDVVGPADVTVEWNGHEYTVEGDAFDDLEFLDAIVEAEEAESEVAAFRAAKALLGAEIWEAFRRNERDPKTGRVKASGFMELFAHVMEVAQRKNS